jgi:hypothetical protein
MSYQLSLSYALVSSYFNVRFSCVMPVFLSYCYRTASLVAAESLRAINFPELQTFHRHGLVRI